MFAVGGQNQRFFSRPRRLSGRFGTKVPGPCGAVGGALRCCHQGATPRPRWLRRVTLSGGRPLLLEDVVVARVPGCRKGAGGTRNSPDEFGRTAVLCTAPASAKRPPAHPALPRRGNRRRVPQITNTRSSRQRCPSPELFVLAFIGAGSHLRAVRRNRGTNPAGPAAHPLRTTPENTGRTSHGHPHATGNPPRRQQLRTTVVQNPDADGRYFRRLIHADLAIRDCAEFRGRPRTHFFGYPVAGPEKNNGAATKTATGAEPVMVRRRRGLHREKRRWRGRASPRRPDRPVTGAPVCVVSVSAS